MLLRRLVVVSVADAEPGPSTLFASRFLRWLAEERRVRTLLVLGHEGAWRDHLVGHGTVFAADDLDDWWAPRLWAHLGTRRGHRQLRWLRARWWRLRLRVGRARLVPVSGPLPGSVAQALPRWMQERTADPTPPTVLAPPAGGAASPGAFVGIGPWDGVAGVDLWLRAVHAASADGSARPVVWLRTGPQDEVADPVRHETWHLGLEDVVESRPVDEEVTPFQVADAGVLVLAARPGGDALADLDHRVPGAAWFVRTGQLPVVHFADPAHPLPPEVAATAVPYPDVHALAAAALEAAPLAADEVAERLDRLVGAAGRP